MKKFEDYFNVIIENFVEIHFHFPRSNFFFPRKQDLKITTDLNVNLVIAKVVLSCFSEEGH